jgi:mannose-6-phosphate isomerase-like protein (cupin superfamily)
MSDAFAASFDQVPETEGFPNNFRRAVIGLELGVNQIRWVHPTELPEHTHPDAEQAIVVIEGEVEFTIDGQRLRLRAGDVAIIPRHVPHSGRSVGTDARFVEVFGPARVQNLAGFLGRQATPAPGGE